MLAKNCKITLYRVKNLKRVQKKHVIKIYEPSKSFNISKKFQLRNYEKNDFFYLNRTLM